MLAAPHDMPRHRHLPLTQMLLDLAAASPDRLAKANPERMSKHYGIKVEWCREYLDRARQASWQPSK